MILRLGADLSTGLTVQPLCGEGSFTPIPRRQTCPRIIGGLHELLVMAMALEVPCFMYCCHEKIVAILLTNQPDIAVLSGFGDQPPHALGLIDHAHL